MGIAEIHQALRQPIDPECIAASPQMPANALPARGEEALSRLERREQPDRYSKEWWLEIARVCADRSDHAEAEVSYLKALQIAPNDIAVLNRYGAFLAEVRRMVDAIRHFNKSLKINGCQYRTLLQRGRAFESLGKWEEALRDYETASRIEGTESEVWACQGNALFYLSRFADALQAYDMATQFNPGDAQSWINKGICFTEHHRYREALACFEKAGRLGHPGGSQLIATCKKDLAG
ncbi:MAG: tetratricopeptide repeat protein [Burkholderiales bacterium]